MLKRMVKRLLTSLLVLLVVSLGLVGYSFVHDRRIHDQIARFPEIER